MKTLATRWNGLLDQQHQHPTGFVGALIGERMVRQHAPETHWTRDLLALRPTDHALELGCGAGRGLALATQQAPHGQVVGVDLSEAMIAAAARRNRVALDAGRLALLRSDFSALPFAAACFDKIFSIHTFYFWPEPLAVITNLLDFLKPNGLLVLTLATGTVTHTGDDVYWPLYHVVEAVVQQLQVFPISSATLLRGPNSRSYNNVAIVVQQ